MTDAPNHEVLTGDERLRKVERLTQRAQFLQTQRAGKRHSSGPFVIYAAKNQLGFNRIGLTTSRKVGNAVVRKPMASTLPRGFSTSETRAASRL